MVALVDLDHWLDAACVEADEDLPPIPLRDDEHITYIGLSLNPNDRKLVSTTLVKNSDLFALTGANMSGGSPNIITHRLSIYKEARPVAQKK